MLVQLQKLFLAFFLLPSFRDADATPAARKTGFFCILGTSFYYIIGRAYLRRNSSLLRLSLPEVDNTR